MVGSCVLEEAARKTRSIGSSWSQDKASGAAEAAKAAARLIRTNARGTKRSFGIDLLGSLRETICLLLYWCCKRRKASLGGQVRCRRLREREGLPER